MPIPERIKNAPELLPGLEFTLGAWLDLNTTRDFGFDEGPIPWTEVENYADRHGINQDDQEREDLHFLIRALDTEYAEFRNRQRKNANGNS